MNELYHHGVRGQKWGVRRASKPKKSVTRYSDSEDYMKTLSKGDRKRANKARNTMYKKADAIYTKHPEMGQSEAKRRAYNSTMNKYSVARGIGAIYTVNGANMTKALMATANPGIIASGAAFTAAAAKVTINSQVKREQLSRSLKYDKDLEKLASAQR